MSLTLGTRWPYHPFMNTANTIHKAELLRCGCRVSPTTGETFSLCPRHTCNLAARADELSEHALTLMPVPKHPEGLKALCPVCSSQRIVPVGENAAGINLVCRDCGELFAASQIIGYGASDGGCPRKCDCGAVHYGQTDTCSLCSQREAI